MTEAEKSVHEFRLGLMSINHILRMCRLPFEGESLTQLVLEVDTPTFYDLHTLLVHTIEPWDFTAHIDVMSLTVAHDEFIFEGTKIRRRR